MTVPITVNVPLELLAAFGGNDEEARRDATDTVTQMVITSLQAIPNVTSLVADQFVEANTGRGTIAMWDESAHARFPSLPILNFESSCREPSTALSSHALPRTSRRSPLR